MNAAASPAPLAPTPRIDAYLSEMTPPVYRVWVHHPETMAVLDFYDAVPDDFGTLTRSAIAARCVSMADSEAHFEHEHEAYARFVYGPTGLPANKRPPEPVTVEVSEDADGFIDRPLTDINVGNDERASLGAMFRLNVAGNYDGPLWLTQGQLAALLVAAEQLVKPARAARRRQPRASA